MIILIIIIHINVCVCVDFPQVNKEAAKRFVKSALWEEGELL